MSTVCIAVAAVFVASAGLVAPRAAADTCPPGHLKNAYSGTCYVVGSAPTINGVPCVASNLGLCRSFRQNQQPPRRPRSSVG
jgi:hypothetical protein